jgi:hypothetical protein
MTTPSRTTTHPARYFCRGSPYQCRTAAPKPAETCWRYRRTVATYRIYDSTDENGMVGTFAPRLFPQEGR